MILPPSPDAPNDRGSQSRDAPCVYLDICAYRKIINDPALAARFEQALLTKGGTLALSSHVFAEFASPNNAGDAPKLGDLIDRLYPRLYFQQWHHEKVIIAELTHGALADGNEDADWDLFFGEMQNVWDPSAPNARVGDVFRALGIESAFRDVLRHRLRKLMAAEVSKFEEWADRAEAHPNVRAHITTMLTAAASDTRATRCLRHTVMYRYLLNRARPRTTNDVYDIGHSIVSTAYCEFVVLDSYWNTITNEACREIRKAGSTAPLAKVFPVGKIDDFVDALEHYKR